jgi:hypothetical protein
MIEGKHWLSRAAAGKRGRFLAWALVAALFAGSLDVADRPLVADNQIYFFLAERAASGVPPHVSMVDPKNDLAVLLTAAAMRVGRLAGIDDVATSRAVSLVFFAAAIALAAELAATLTGSAAAGHVAALALLSVRGLAEHAAVGSNVKVFLVAFVLLAHLAAAHGSRRAKGRSESCDLLAGLAAGAAFAVWQPALLVVGAVVFEALLSRRGGWRRAAVVAASATLPFAACEAWFASVGALGPQLHQTQVMALGSLHEPRRLGAALRFVLQEGGPRLRVVPCAFALSWIAAAVVTMAAPRRAWAMARDRGGLASFVVGASASTAFTLYDHQGVPDLFFPYPYFAVGGALLVAVAASLASKAASRIRPGLSVGASAFVFAAAGLALCLPLRDFLRHRQAPAYDLRDQRRLADEVRALHAQHGSVWVYGAVHLLGLAHLDNHVPIGLYYDDLEALVRRDDYRPLREGRMPEIIVHTRGVPPGGSRFLLDEYVEITPPNFAAQLAMVWRRVEPARAGEGSGKRSSLRQGGEFPCPASLPTVGARWERAHRPARPGGEGSPLPRR